MKKTNTKGRAGTIDKYVGAQILKIRTERGMSQTAIAAAAGVTFQQVQKYEKGTNRISAGNLAAISKVLTVPVHAFFPAEYSAAPNHKGA